jgi:CcmD family protein
MKIILPFFLIILSLTRAAAQQEVEMADALRTEGKIYVIVLIILIVLAGMFVYLFLLDRKVKKLENRLK